MSGSACFENSERAATGELSKPLIYWHFGAGSAEESPLRRALGVQIKGIGSYWIESALQAQMTDDSFRRL